MPFFKRTHFEVRQSLRCLWGTAATPLEMPEATPTSIRSVSFTATQNGDVIVQLCFVWSAALACGARVLCVCVCWSRASVCVAARARRCVLHDVLCCAPVYCAVQRRLGWQGCAVGCGALRVVARLPDGVRRPRSPPDRVVGGPGREHAVGAACEAAARLARMFPCGEGRAYVFTLRARAGAGGGVVSPRSDAGWSSA